MKGKKYLCLFINLYSTDLKILPLSIENRKNTLSLVFKLANNSDNLKKKLS